MLNELSLQRGRGLYLSDLCSIKHFTLGEIEEFDYTNFINNKTDSYGFEKYYQLLYSLVLDSKDVADILWMEDKIWYADITNEWDFFIERCLSTTKTLLVELSLEDANGEFEALALDGIMKEALNAFLDLKGEFVFIQKNIENSDKPQIILCNTNIVASNNDGIDKYFIDDSNFKFTEHYYRLTTEFLKKIHWIKSDYDFLHCGTKAGAKIMFKNMYKDRQKNKKQSVSIDTINSALNIRGISYTWDMPIYKFYDAYYRLNKYDEYKNTISALYSGAIDTKKNPINEDKINWASIITI